MSDAGELTRRLHAGVGKTSTVMAATGARSGTVSLSATERQAWLCVGTGREPASSWPTHVLDAIEGRSRHEGQHHLDGLDYSKNNAQQVHGCSFVIRSHYGASHLGFLCMPGQ